MIKCTWLADVTIHLSRNGSTSSGAQRKCREVNFTDPSDPAQ
jgi:hypothetical protein